MGIKQGIALSLGISVGLSLIACQTVTPSKPKETISSESVVNTYINIAQANYGDALISAQALESQIDTFLNSPTEENLSLAKQAWITARIPYQQTEVYRFGNSVVDD